jgi:hypothetical protein
VKSWLSEQGRLVLLLLIVLRRVERKVTVVDDNPDVGGQIWRAEKQKSSSAEAAKWFERIRQAKIQFINGAHVYEQTTPENFSLKKIMTFTK